MTNSNTLIVSINDLFDAILSNHKTIQNRGQIIDAYNFAKDKHSGVFRNTGEEYIMHPLRVAITIASWGCESSWIIAALLHDVVEDVDSISLNTIEELFGKDIAEYVDHVTKIDKNQPPYDSLSKIERHNLTDAKLLTSKCDASIYIKFADRIDNLKTINGLPETKRIDKAIHTRDILIPLASIVKAEKICSELEDLILPILHPEEYATIISSFDNYKRANLYGFNATLSILKNELSSCANSSMKSFLVGKRSLASIYRQAVRDSENINTSFAQHLRKTEIAWYDLTLIFKDSDLSNDSYYYDVFFKFYEEHLINKNIYIIRTKKTTRKDSTYILLRDSLGNRFRLFIKSESEYQHYEIGNIVDSFNNISSLSVIKTNPASSYNPKIKVFLRDGAPHVIEKGATVLDLAFDIHTEIGLHFDYALINNCKVHQPAYYTLSEGDKIDVRINEDSETVDLSWMKYLKTSDGITKLYKYYSKVENLKKVYYSYCQKSSITQHNRA